MFATAAYASQAIGPLTPWSLGMKREELPPFLWDILWMGEMLHQMENMGNHCVLIFTGESSFQSFSGGAGFRPSTVSMVSPQFYVPPKLTMNWILRSNRFEPSCRLSHCPRLVYLHSLDPFARRPRATSMGFGCVCRVGCNMCVGTTNRGSLQWLHFRGVLKIVVWVI